MKVALIGNMNNNFFSICRYLRDAGYDAHLFLLNEYAHFLPGHDSFSDEYKSYTYQTDWHNYNFFDAKLKEKIKSDLEGFDFIIACDIMPAYLKLIDRKLDVFIPYGGDMLYYIKPQQKIGNLKLFYRLIRGLRPIDPPKQKAKCQLEGILESKLFIADFFGAEVEKFINTTYSTVNRKKMSMPMVYDTVKEYTSALPQTELFNKVTKAKAEGKKIFLSSMRHNWTAPTSEDPSKGNDIIVKAFASFLNRYENKAMLVLFEYGNDVNATKALIKELGVEERVIWSGLMERKYIMLLMKQVDLCMGNVATPYLTYGVVLEAFLTKTPFVHNYNSLHSEFDYEYLYDTFHASNPEELFSVMETIYLDPSVAIQKVEHSYDWYKQEIVDKFINVIASAIAQKTKAA